MQFIFGVLLGAYLHNEIISAIPILDKDGSHANKNASETSS